MLNLRDLRYLVAVHQHRHFGRAATACGVSQPTLSAQLGKLEQALGLTLFERTARGAVPTAACERMIPHAAATVAEAEALLAAARDLRDPLAGRFRLGIIPTLAPHLLPLIFAPLQTALPALALEPWEDQTAALLDRLRASELDAALIATDVDGPDLLSRPLFDEPFLAALPPDHALTAATVVAEADLAADILVLADGHCLRDQTLAACGGAIPRATPLGGPLRAASLATLLNMVAAGYGTTLVPGLAAGQAEDSGLALRPLREGSGRTIRIAWRARFPRQAAVDAIARVIATRLAAFAGAARAHLAAACPTATAPTTQPA